MSLSFSVTFGVPKNIIYKAFLDEFELTKLTRTKAHMKAEAGGEFNLYEGKIVGKNLELVRARDAEKGRADQAGVEAERLGVELCRRDEVPRTGRRSDC